MFSGTCFGKVRAGNFHRGNPTWLDMEKWWGWHYFWPLRGAGAILQGHRGGNKVTSQVSSGSQESGPCIFVLWSITFNYLCFQTFQHFTSYLWLFPFSAFKKPYSLSSTGTYLFYLPASHVHIKDGDPRSHLLKTRSHWCSHSGNPGKYCMPGTGGVSSSPSGWMGPFSSVNHKTLLLFCFVFPVLAFNASYKIVSAL